MRRTVVVLLAFVSLLCVPSLAHANGDPASDYLLVQDIFLPFNRPIDPDAKMQLTEVVQQADKAGFKIKVALIASKYDLGTAFSLYNKAQRYAEFLGYELSFVYSGRLLIVMPKGFGYTVNGKPNPRLARALRALPNAGRDGTSLSRAATDAVRRLANADGVRLGSTSGGGSQARDRLTIAAAATAGIALIAGVVLYRRGRTPSAGR